MNICFVSNFEKTLVFNSIAKILQEKHSYKIFWIVVNSKYNDLLLEEYPANHILYIHKGLNQNTEEIGEYKLNELVYHDRFLSLNKHKSLNFLIGIQEPIYEFIKFNEIQAVFGELTWSHELLINRILADKLELKCNYYRPHVIRIPVRRFAFFENENDDFNIDSYVDYKLLDHPLVKIKKPDYLKVNEKIIEHSYKLSAKLNRVKRFFSKQNVERDDPSVIYEFRYRLKNGLNEEINRYSYKLLKTVHIDTLKTKKFVLYPLHVQPESSIDILGRYYSDQFVNITNIWKLLPNNWFIVIKEHTNGIGNRSLSELKKISRLPNLLFVNERTDSHELIRLSEAVFTVGGTIAYEAALLDKPAFTFAPLFFNKLENCHRVITSDFESHKNITDLINSKNATNIEKMELSEFSNFVHHHSYEGVWAPTDKGVFSEQNIENLAFAIMKSL